MATHSEVQELLAMRDELGKSVHDLGSQATDSLDEGANYKFVLCKAKINFINSLISDIDAALAGQVPDVLVESTIQTVRHIHDNFQEFLGTCGAPE